MLVTDAVATALTELDAPRHAETTRSGDIPEHWPRRRFDHLLRSCDYPRLRSGDSTLGHRSVSYHLRVEAGVRTGGCLCGAVRYSVRGDPVHVGRCHCADCRKESGSAFIVYGQWPIEAFDVSGEISSYGGRGFCPLCGSRLLDPVGPGDTLIEIRLGSLDEAPFELKPEAEVWVKRASAGSCRSRGQRNTTKIVPSALASFRNTGPFQCLL